MRILAVDYGDARTGLASCDKYESIASPVGTVAERNQDVLVRKISDKAKELGTEHIVVGLPMNMDGSRGERAQKCEEFAKKLSESTGLEVSMWDERVTTVQAIGILNETNVRGKRRKAVIDTVAATLILESYLEYRKKKRV
ncbi:MAG TPA: Holliday junction resolvase RuvX [Candidatus Faeciplasma gallinarum]|uniref:Putative pre-16S rRNA nuclease n=1 Tax=Candidatus Faeciplasma gallinarum TaxID=2840799 RepID=A0A9D1ENQ8_9FIRM|nr:Holliday junction resolvase RuvX [Candidatus Faeciplasma gallinarum]